MRRKTIFVIFGTRPEAIKMAPVINELKKYNDKFDTKVIVTAQHREMLDQVLHVFDIEPDFDLNIMKGNQSLSDITSSVLRGLENIFIKSRPDLILVHGDTTSSFTAALTAYYHQIPIGHVEAGLRTLDTYNPFPEEGNRQLIDALSDLYFVPTENAKKNLLLENKEDNKIFVTGNTAIDAIKYTSKGKPRHKVLDLIDSKSEKKWILFTMHRRENFGNPMEDVFEAILSLAKKHKDIEILLPLHMNPKIIKLANEKLSNKERINLVEALDVNIFHKVISKTHIVLTDSGGIQEEAPALDKPVLVLREKTERPEGIIAGTLRLVGTKRDSIVNAVEELIKNDNIYSMMAKSENPYGDGYASQQIVNHISKYFDSKMSK